MRSRHHVAEVRELAAVGALDCLDVADHRQHGSKNAPAPGAPQPRSIAGRPRRAEQTAAWNKAADAAEHDDLMQRARAAADLAWWNDAGRAALDDLDT